MIRKNFKNIQIMAKVELWEHFNDIFMQSEANSKGEFLSMLLENYLNPDYETALKKITDEKNNEVSKLIAGFEQLQKSFDDYKAAKEKEEQEAKEKAEAEAKAKMEQKENELKLAEEKAKAETENKKNEAEAKEKKKQEADKLEVETKAKAEQENADNNVSFWDNIHEW
ncbi:MAG: hypothetical protein WC223_02545 [Bacteroidales bacterium]|jgi:hypothetical protein